MTNHAKICQKWSYQINLNCPLQSGGLSLGLRLPHYIISFLGSDDACEVNPALDHNRLSTCIGIRWFQTEGETPKICSQLQGEIHHALEPCLKRTSNNHWKLPKQPKQTLFGLPNNQIRLPRNGLGYVSTLSFDHEKHWILLGYTQMLTHYCMILHSSDLTFIVDSSPQIVAGCPRIRKAPVMITWMACNPSCSPFRTWTIQV